MRQFGSQRVFFDQPIPEYGKHNPAIPDPHRLLLLAIERALAPPVVHMRTTLQPMRVIVIHPGDGGNDTDCFAEPNLLPLPQASMSFPQLDREIRQRIVQGEILSDDNGGLFERVGQQLRPIHHLASGPAGELIDVVPVDPGRLHLLSAATGLRGVSSQTIHLSSEPEQAGNLNDSTSTFIPLSAATEQTTPTHRKLFADPGQWRVVWWGDFKEILARQLAHPERLRDTYRLPCYVQVFETERAVRIEELAAVYQRENESRTSLFFLTDEIVARLELGKLLSPLPVRTRNEQRTPHLLLPHDRVFRLLVANDPTVDVANLKGSSDSQNSTQAATDQKESTARVALKEEIPNRFAKEWEFKISREEAIYDINAKPTLGTLMRWVVHRLQIFRRRNELDKWRALLAGREIDEQLWAVRPPSDMVSISVVREWAARTLALGGYDASKMISEWEIFWRRKQL